VPVGGGFYRYIGILGRFKCIKCMIHVYRVEMWFISGFIVSFKGLIEILWV
jgi:hypothetical protein